jgi:hypothetical protein
MNRKQYQIAQAAAQETLCNTARDCGREHHRLFPDQMLVAVMREASLLHPDNKEAQLAYLQGYADARRQRDEYLKEKQL